MKKIAIFGAHCSAKTTLVYKLAAFLKMNLLNVTVVHETARQCPFPINDKAVYQTTLHVVSSQMKKELEAEAEGFEVCISDRTLSDAFVYIKYIKRDNSLVRELEKFCMRWVREYDMLVYLEPNVNFQHVDDGVRTCDLDFLRGVTDEFRNLVSDIKKQHKDKINIIESEAQYIFDEKACLNLMNKIKGSLFDECKQPNLA